MLPVSGKLWPSKNTYIYKKMETQQAKSLFFVRGLVRVSCPSAAINWRSTCIVALEIHQNVEKAGQSIHERRNFLSHLLALCTVVC